MHKIKAFNTLANHLKSIYEISNDTLDTTQKVFVEAIQKTTQANPWFTADNIKFAILSLAEMLSEKSLQNWLLNYVIRKKKHPLTIGVVMAGNIPLVGFHDFLCVLMSGNRFLGKLSHDDPFLLPAVASMLQEIDSTFSDLISFTNERLSNFDAIIATGGDNTARYFNYYFRKYPHLIRKNRNSVAVLTGEETVTDFEKLTNDVFRYFGMGCRSISTLLVPNEYDFSMLLAVLSKQTDIINHARYFNNYEFNKAVFLINKEPHLDNGCLLLRQSEQLNTPISVLHYHYYNSIDEVYEFLNCNSEKIQCVVSKNAFILSSFDFGASQNPEIQDYADGVDTMHFLLNLNEEV